MTLTFENCGGCRGCKFDLIDTDKEPCKHCIHCCGEINGKEFFTPKIQPTEEINHPDRYKSGKYECIEVMSDVFGKEAVKDFCLLNAFKYIWRQEKKGGVQDVKKAVCYLSKYSEWSDSHENV